MKKDQSAEGKRTVQVPTTLYLGLELSNTKLVAVCNEFFWMASISESV
jgi:hypothetical protein